jgi:hypothetical protein
MKTCARWLKRGVALVPAFFLFQVGACLPNNAFAEVLAENIVLTSAIVIQSVVSIILGNVFTFV